MNANRYMPTIDWEEGSGFVARIKDRLWGGYCSLDNEGKTIPLVWRGDDAVSEAQDWLNRCYQIWESGKVTSPPLIAEQCCTCGKMTSRPVSVRTTHAASTSGWTDYMCPKCLPTFLSPYEIVILRQEHVRYCPTCKKGTHCEELDTILNAFHGAKAVVRARARRLGH